MSRPASLLVAVVVLAVERVGGLAWAVVLAWLMATFGDVDPWTAIMAAASVGFGVAALVAVVGAWRGRPWGWLLGAVLQAAVLLGVVVAGLSGGRHPALAGALVLAAAGLGGLFAPPTRRALGV